MHSTGGLRECRPCNPLQAIKQHPSALQQYRERLSKEGTVSKEQACSFALTHHFGSYMFRLCDPKTAASTFVSSLHDCLGKFARE